MRNISVVILTYNEEINIAACIESCDWSDDIVVFDSHSTDKTVDIALKSGARVYKRPFDNYASQRNASLQEVEYRNPWVLMVDADERAPTELANEMTRAIATAPPNTAIFRMRRKDFMFGKWLRRSSGYPTWFGRLVRIGHVRVEREVNEEYVTDGGIGLLEDHLHHYPLSKGMAWWYERHNRYSTLEANKITIERDKHFALGDLFSSDPMYRRRTLKQIAYRTPARPVIAFLYLYIFRLGFLDGLPGLYFSAMRASYELMIDLKIKESQASQNKTAKASDLQTSG